MTLAQIGTPTVGTADHVPAEQAPAVRAAHELLTVLGVLSGGDHTRLTAQRMVASYKELLSPRPFEATTFANDELVPSARNRFLAHFKLLLELSILALNSITSLLSCNPIP